MCNECSNVTLTSKGQVAMAPRDLLPAGCSSQSRNALETQNNSSSDFLKQSQEVRQRIIGLHLVNEPRIEAKFLIRHT